MAVLTYAMELLAMCFELVLQQPPLLFVYYSFIPCMLRRVLQSNVLLGLLRKIVNTLHTVIQTGSTKKI